MRRTKKGWLFIAPALILLISIVGYPIVYLLVTSTYQYNYINPAVPREFVGLSNYGRLIQDSRFLQTSLNTAIFTSSAIVIEFILGLLLATLLFKVSRGRRTYIALLLIPMLMMPIAVGLTWRFMYNHEYGIFSYLLREAGLLGETALLVNPHTALLCIIFTDIWEWTPLMALILFAGLMALPLEPFEKAKIDGASGWQTFRHLTFPLLIPSVMVALLIRIADAARVLDIVYRITGGGPGIATETAHLFSYKIFFKSFNVGYGSAQIVILLAIILVVCVILFKVLERTGGG